MAGSFLNFRRVAFAYPGAPDPVLHDLDFSIPPGWTGVVGANGAGTTTLLQLAAGLLDPSDGLVDGPGGILCAQRTDEPPENLGSFLLGEDAASWRWRIELRLGSDWGVRWDSLSHGERKRLQLAVALWRNPPVLVVDEPTNHVDRETVDTIRTALAAYRGTGLLVSHDRDLLDGLCGRCLFLAGAKAMLRPGGYSQGAEQERRERLRRGREQAELDREVRLLRDEQRCRREFANRAERDRSKRGLAKGDRDGRTRADAARVADGGSGAVLRQIEGRLAQALERRQTVEVSRDFAVGVRLKARPAGKPLLLSLADGTLALGPARTLEIPSLTVRSGDRIGISGPNGAGKSTLLRAFLAGAALPEGALAYLPQEIDRERGSRILEEIRGLGGTSLGRVMTLVRRLGSDPGRLLQSQEPSPGELRKLLLARVLLAEPCLLLLDEPTNHLDLPSVECLEEALAAYEGSMVLVSHDDRLLSRLATRRWFLCPTGIPASRVLLREGAREG